MNFETVCAVEELSTSIAESNGLKAKRLRRALTAPALSAEIAHILRRPPSLQGEVLDAGSMCRDSAVIVAAVAARLGMSASICTGEAAIFAPIADGTQTCLHFKTHAWTDIESFGICDFSPDLRPGAFPGWADLPVRYLAGTRYFPGGKEKPAYHVQDDDSFLCTRRIFETVPSGFRAAYLEQERLPFDTQMFFGAVNFAQSPLIKELSRERFFSLDLLGKAALHVWRVIKDKTPSLTTTAPAQVWPTIAQIDSAAVEQFRLMSRLAEITF